MLRNIILLHLFCGIPLATAYADTISAGSHQQYQGVIMSLILVLLVILATIIFSSNTQIVVNKEPVCTKDDEEHEEPSRQKLIEEIAQKESDLRKMEELDQLKSEFLATLSHELKTPLVSIKGYLELISSGKMGPLTEKQEKALEISIKNTVNLNNMISSILNFARMEAGKLKFYLSFQKIGPLIKDVVYSMAPIAQNRKIAIKPELAADLPQVFMDAELMYRVFNNLIENAIKFSPDNSEIIISAKEVSDKHIEVSVKDSGCGITTDKIELIKKPFFQIDQSDTRPTGGMGLGLPICEKILTGHGTSLTIQSGPNEGSKFSFLLTTK